MYNANWDDFIGKNSNNLTGAFEDLARFLFRKKYNVSYALPYFKNHPGNETEVVSRGDEIIGFQAKYFENEIDANNIIHSIKTAKEWNPTQTLIIIYTNKEFGVPKTKGNKISQKQDKIQKAAHNVGIKIEWMLGDNILDLVNENPIAYDVFFNLRSHIQNLNHVIEESNEAKFSCINSSIKYGDTVISIERADYIEKIKGFVEQGQNLVLVGESGVGKSAIFKDFYDLERHDDKLILFTLDARQLETKSVNEIFSLEENYTLKEFCEYYQDVQTKLIYIDSAEKLLEYHSTSTSMLLIDKLRREEWIFLFSCKSNCLKDFVEKMENDYHLSLNTLEVHPLSEDTLLSLAQKHSIVLPDDKKLLSQLRIPFYLARYVEIGQNAQINLSTFKERVWNQKVRGIARGAEQQKREECLVTIAKKLQESTLYYIRYSDVCDKDAAYSLIEQDVLAEVIHKGYTIKHDIYSDWALTYYVDQKMSEGFGGLKAIPQTTDYQNAFVCWLQEQLDENVMVVDNLCKKVFNHEIDDFWVSSIFYSFARGQIYTSRFLDKFDAYLKENNYFWFNEFVKELCISCKKINRYFNYKGRQYPQYVAYGGGWETVIEYIYKKQDKYFLANIFIVYNVLASYVGMQHHDDVVAHHAGLLALRIFKEEIKSRENGVHFYIDNPEQWSSLVCLYSPFLKEELHNIINDTVKNKWVGYKYPYHNLTEFIVKKANVSYLLPVCIICHDVLPELLQVYWEERLDEEEYKPWRSSYKESEYYFGLDEELEGIGGYFPSSALQTPIYLLLKTEFDISPQLHHTFDFIIDFINKCVDTYDRRGQKYDQIEKINVVLPDGNKSTILSSQALWNLYRGTSGLTMPNLLECIHMALEKFLLKLCEEKTLHGYVAKLLEQILNKSHSASLWAVVASVVTAHFEEFFDILLIFYQNYRFLGLDLTRFTHEITAQTLSFAYIGKELMGKERKESNELKHRQNHLEKVLQGLQISYSDSDKPQDKKRLEQLYKCVDVIKKQVSEIPQEEKEYEDYMIARIDYRSMIKEEVTLENGMKALQITPNLTEAQKNTNQDFAKSNMQMVKGVKLREWINKQYAGNNDVKNFPLEDDIHRILDEIREIEKLLKSKDEVLYKLVGDEFLPYMGCAVLLMNFSKEMTNGEIKECKERLFEALQDKPFLLSNTLSGLEICLNGIPSLLDNCLSEEEKKIMDICLDYVQSTYQYGNTRPCDLMRYMLIQRKVWLNHTEFMEKCVNELLERHKEHAFSVELARAIACLLANSASHNDLLVKSMETLSSEWMPNVSNHGHEYPSHERFKDADLIADIIINSQVSGVSEIMSFFCRYISKNDSYEPLVGCLLLKCVSYGNYEQFWAAWHSLYDSMIKNIGKRTNSNVVNEYLLNPSFLVDNDTKWFKIKENDVQFFEKVLADAGDNPSVLRNVVKVFDTIGYDYSLKIVPTIASVIENKTIYDDDKDMMKALLFNMENFVRSILADFETVINSDKPLKLNVKAILLFMKQQGSTQAADFLRNM